MKLNLYLAALVCVALAGCSGAKELERSMTVSGYDFTPYTAKGFFISPEQYLEPYEPVGVISITFSPEVRSHTRFTTYDSTKYALVNSPSGEFCVERVDVRMVIEQTYRQAVKMGANGVSRFLVVMKPMADGDLIYFGAEVSGFAIKRK